METNIAQNCSDWISNLPEPIISTILSCLPTKSAFATSFLSKGWKLRWTKVTTLDFHDKLWPDSPTMSFVEFVNMVLVNHIAEIIEKFCLRYESCDLPSVYLNIWINSAISRCVRVLELDVVPGEVYQDEVILPAGIYTCGTLEVLKLKGRILVRLPRVVRLPKVAVMELIEVRYESDESLHNLVSSCLRLESLAIKRLYDDNLVVCKVSSPVMKRLHMYTDGQCICPHPVSHNYIIEINAPALEFLALQDTLSPMISIHDVASVNEVELDISCCCTGKEINPRADMIVGVVQAFHHARSLKLSESTMIGLTKASKKLSTSFERVTKLVLEIDRSLWSCVLDFMDRCINLEVLVIFCWDVFYEDSSAADDDEDDDEDDKHDDDGDGDDDEDDVDDDDDDAAADDRYWREPIRVPACLSTSLRKASFRASEWYGDEISMIKFILNHGLLMERLDLCSKDKSCEHIKMLTMFPRVSAACKIWFS